LKKGLGMIDTVVPKRRKLQRVGAEDFSFAEEALKTAELVIVPEDQTQRAAFEKLMPHLYVLRNKGCSWPQLTGLLNQSGFKLQPSTVRTYYSEMLVKCMDLCQARMNVQIDVMKKLREENARIAGGDTELAALAKRVNSQMNKLQEKTSSRVNQLFGLDSTPSYAQPALLMPTPIKDPVQHGAQAHHSPSVDTIGTTQATPPRSTPARQSARTPVSVATPAREEQAEEPTDDFGLLGLGKAQHSADRPAGFFSLESDVPSAPVPAPAAHPTPSISSRAPTAPTPAPAAAPANTQGESTASIDNAIPKRCAPLKAGITPMKRRANVPDEVYEPGLLEHPAIPGLMLTLEERLYGAGLEYCDVDGDEAGIYQNETQDEKRFRVTWRKIVPMTPTRTANSFMKMDNSLFRGRS
jgi:hypothetical protein